MKSFKRFIKEAGIIPTDFYPDGSPVPPGWEYDPVKDQSVPSYPDWGIDPADDTQPEEPQIPEPTSDEERKLVQDGWVEAFIKGWIIDNLPGWVPQSIIDMILGGHLEDLVDLLNSGELPQWMIDQLTSILQQLLDDMPSELDSLPYFQWHLQQMIQQLLDLLNG